MVYPMTHIMSATAQLSASLSPGPADLGVPGLVPNVESLSPVKPLLSGLLNMPRSLSNRLTCRVDFLSGRNPDAGDGGETSGLLRYVGESSLFFESHRSGVPRGIVNLSLDPRGLDGDRGYA